MYYTTAQKFNVQKFCQQYARHRHFMLTATTICDNCGQSRGKLDKWWTIKLSCALSCIQNHYDVKDWRIDMSLSLCDICIFNT